MRDIPIYCCTTSLALENALYEIQEDRGEEYGLECFELVRCTNDYLYDKRSKYSYYTSDLPAYIDVFRNKVNALRFRNKVKRYSPMVPKSDFKPYVDTIVEYAAEISKEPWISEWKDDVTDCFSRFKHLVAYANEKMAEEFLLKKPLKPPAVYIASPMGALYDASYHEHSDLLIFLTAGLKYKWKLYNRMKIKHGFHPGKRYAWPYSYAKMAYIISEEVAHRYLHLPRWRLKRRYTRDSFLEEDLCERLAVSVVLKMTYSDKRLTKEDVFRLLPKEWE